MNPFVYNSPVRGKDFFNREKPVEKILKETVTGKTQGNVWITGERQIGKTSLLRHIQSFNENNKQTVIPYGSKRKLDVAFIFVNVQGCNNEEEFFNSLWQGMKDFFDFKVRKTSSAYKNFINGLDEAYNKRKHYIVFLVDEFDAFIETLASQETPDASKFLAKLSSLLQEVDEIKHDSKIFSCVFTANHDITEMLNENYIDIRGSGLIVEAITLKWFTKTQTKQLAKKYLEGDELQFTNAELDLCFNSTQGYPYFTQKMLSLMYETRQRIDNDRIFVKVVKNEFGQMFKETIEDWGGDNIPTRTLKKLKEMAKKMDIQKQVSTAIFKSLELYIRAKMVHA
jgi:AAA+ ATPase superfamily predicted ATPase